MNQYTDEEAIELLKKLIKRNKRTPAQNKKMQAMLGDISDQVEWDGEHLTKTDWKWMLTASLRGQRVVRAIDFGFVYLGEPTSTMTKKHISQLIELMYAFGAQHDVIWTEETRQKAGAVYSQSR
tara:strand:+ start:309 stop:680 length:372 start_codon:yes stop_codon:yes gene_type:complete